MLLSVVMVVLVLRASKFYWLNVMDYFSLFASKMPLVADVNGHMEIYVYDDEFLPYVQDPKKIVIVDTIAKDSNPTEANGTPIFDAITGKWYPFNDTPKIVMPSELPNTMQVMYDPYLKMMLQLPNGTQPILPQLSVSKRTLTFNVKQNGISFKQVWDMSPGRYRDATRANKTPIDSSDANPVVYFTDIVHDTKKVDGPIYTMFVDGDWKKMSRM
jgi:hypothetical protein